MLSLTLPLDDKLFKAIATTAERLGLTTEAFALQALRTATSLDPNPKPQLILDESVPGLRRQYFYLTKALNRIKSLDDGTVFTLSANHEGSIRLFSSEEWAKMKSQPDFSPTVFGKQFLRYVSNHPTLVRVLDKTSDHKQLYAKIGAAELAESTIA